MDPAFALAQQISERCDKALFACNRDGTILVFNPAAERLFGWSRREALGSTWFELLASEDDDGAAAFCLEQVLHGAVSRCDAITRTSDGRRLGISVDVSRVGPARDPLVLAVVLEARPERALGGTRSDFDDVRYLISSEPTTFGTIIDAWPPLDASGRSLVGESCFRVLHGISAPCDNCPAVGALALGETRTAVIRHGDDPERYHLSVARGVSATTSQISTRILDEAMITSLVQARISAVADRADLTMREREVLAYLVLGRSPRDISTILGITPRTVKFHQTRILTKLGAESRLDLNRLFF